MTPRRILIALLLCVAGLPAHAGMRKCDRDQLMTEDFNAVHPLIARAAGGREIHWPLKYVCVARNYASAVAPLKSEPQSDGSQLDFSVYCTRGKFKWACELQQGRSARIELTFEQPTIFDVDLPMDVDIQRVKPLLVRAREVGMKLTNEQECGYQPKGPVRRDADSLSAVRNLFRFAVPTIDADIDKSPGVISLDVYGYVLDFDSDPNDAANLKFRCWSFYIIV